MDSREINHQWYDRFDEDRMVLVLNDESDEEIELPARYEVCDTCDGRGSHTNSSIDRQGLTAEDFAEDPDFAEDYFRGRYDVPCAECHGKRVVPVVDETRATPEQKKVAEQAQDEHYRNQRDEWAAREYGF